MRRVLLTLACAAVTGAPPRAQTPDLGDLPQAVRSGEARPVSDEDIRRLLSAPVRFRNFSEFHGTWVLDDTATAGSHHVGQAAGPAPLDALGVEIARRLVITGSDTQILLTKDARVAEPYAFDGTERQAADARTATTRYSFALVAGALALTARTTTCCDDDRQPRIDILTDAYSLPDFDVLEVRRQLSVLHMHPGSATLSGVRSLPSPITYRRVP